MLTCEFSKTDDKKKQVVAETWGVNHIVSK